MTDYMDETSVPEPELTETDATETPSEALEGPEGAEAPSSASEPSETPSDGSPEAESGSSSGESTQGGTWEVNVVWPYGSLDTRLDDVGVLYAGQPVRVNDETKDRILAVAGEGRVVVSPVSNTPNKN